MTGSAARSRNTTGSVATELASPSTSGRVASDALVLATDIRASLDAILADPALEVETRFHERVEAIERIEFEIVDRIEGILDGTTGSGALAGVSVDAQEAIRRLERADASLFRRVREEIRSGRCRGVALARLLDTIVGRSSPGRLASGQAGYDSLDVFVNGVLFDGEVPAPAALPEPEMVFFQQTPTRIILEMIERAALSPGDVVCDIGSGLGHVALLVNLLSGARAVGVELDAAYCEYARASASSLDVRKVEFLQVDARTADYSVVSTFFMYTPFGGAMLRAVLDRLRQHTDGRRIRLFSYGPCTPAVARQEWLRDVDGTGDQLYRLGHFESV